MSTYENPKYYGITQDYTAFNKAFMGAFDRYMNLYMQMEKMKKEEKVEQNNFDSYYKKLENLDEVPSILNNLHTEIYGLDGEIRKSGGVEVGEDLVVIGHPTGLPTKIADGANVRRRAGTYFVANLDTYGGNSGSAVFNANTGVVEGILVRGETDYRRDYRRNCRVSNVVSDNGGRGEDVTYITNIRYLRRWVPASS